MTTEQTTEEGAAPPTEGVATVTWTCLGQRRVTLAGKQVPSAQWVWRDPQGTDHYLSKLSGVVGGVYCLTVTEGAAGASVVLSGESGPRFVEMSPTSDPERRKWVAAHREAQLLGEMDRAQRKAKSREGAPFGQLTLDELCVWYHIAALPHQRAARLALIISYLERGTLPRPAPAGDD